MLSSAQPSDHVVTFASDDQRSDNRRHIGNCSRLAVLQCGEVPSQPLPQFNSPGNKILIADRLLALSSPRTA
jgi:hypothetical protein